MGYIYIHTNKVNGKKYIGQTTLKPNERWNNGKGYKCQPFYYAIKKYGWENFEHEVYEMNNLLLDGMERFLIEYYHTTDKDFGYNLDSGGNKNKHPSEETRAKMSEAHKGKHNGEKNPMYGRTGDKNPMYGKHHSEEEKANLSKHHEKFHYVIQSPEEELFETNNLNSFCKEHRLDQRHMSAQGKYKGWTVISKELL